MIADSLSAYSRAMQMLDQIRKRAEAVDEYIMRLILASSMFGEPVYPSIPPADTPYADFYTQAAMTSLFAPLMREVSLIAGAQPTIAPVPQAEKTSALVSIPRETATIGDILTRAVAVDTGFSEMHTYTEDTSALADNVADVIRRVGWQFAWPVCFGVVRKEDWAKVQVLRLDAAGSDAYLTISSDQCLMDSGASNWEKVRVGDVFVVKDVSGTALPYTKDELITVHSVTSENAFKVRSDDIMPAQDQSLFPSSEYEGFGGFLIRKVRTP